AFQLAVRRGQLLRHLVKHHKCLTHVVRVHPQSGCRRNVSYCMCQRITHNYLFSVPENRHLKSLTGYSANSGPGFKNKQGSVKPAGIRREMQDKKTGPCARFFLKHWPVSRPCLFRAYLNCTYAFSPPAWYGGYSVFRRRGQPRHWRRPVPAELTNIPDPAGIRADPGHSSAITPANRRPPGGRSG